MSSDMAKQKRWEKKSKQKISIIEPEKRKGGKTELAWETFFCFKHILLIVQTKNVVVEINKKISQNLKVSEKENKFIF